MDGPGQSPRVDTALADLRGRGERVTPAREAVLRVVDAADLGDEHLTAEQIGARVADLEPSVHRATVYRTLSALTDAGVLSHVHLGGSATVYHLADRPMERLAPHPGPAAYGQGDRGEGTHGHTHVQCVVCGRVQDAPAHVLDGAAERLRDALGFELDQAHAALLGTCPDCR